ncbi:Uncharacterised protein [Acinetobacter baumannii]|nr:hypothetical protein WP4W18E11_09320 [Acinetobacter baumannii]SSO49143.1 Uncharacterised protein [Acinetobacter baumannii]SSR64212.1 Uncharacterised protein [Acinetobacter nosocomialis]
MFEAIKNIANNGDLTKDESSTVEWEECKLIYKQREIRSTIVAVSSMN